MSEVHCTNCGAEGATKRGGGCLYKLSYIAGVIFLLMAVGPMLFKVPENITEDARAMLGLCQILGVVGCVIAISLMLLTSYPCCKACNSKHVVKINQWRKMHPKGESNHESESSTKKCPSCAENVKEEAIKCRFCGHEF